MSEQARFWGRVERFDRRAAALADRHYNRQTHGSPQFAPPGRLLVLLTSPADALWVSVHQRHVRHAFPGAWVCSLFRNEDREAHASSDLIREAVACTRWKWGDPPPEGFVTFVDPARVRRKRDPGRCFLRAGWRLVAETTGRSRRAQGRRLLVFRLEPGDFPPPAVPLDQLALEVGR